MLQNSNMHQEKRFKKETSGEGGRKVPDPSPT